MPAAKKTTTSKGLGWKHQQKRAALLRVHHDGTPCPCSDCGAGCPCRAAGLPLGAGLPMWREPSMNIDGKPLEADHTVARSQGGGLADRLLLSTCNRSRGAGTRAAAATEKRYWSREW